MSVYLILGGNGQISNNFIENYINLSVDKLILVDNVFSNKKLFEHNNVFYFTFDVTHSNNYGELTSFLNSQQLFVDKILYAIGKNPMKNFFDSNLSEFKETISSNLIGFYICLKKLYDWFSQDISIVAISSQNGVVGHENRIDYGASKAGLIQIVKNLSIDFSQYSNKNIKVNCISPGYIKTSKNEEFFNTIKGKKLLNRNPYKKATSLNDVSHSINFLLSEKSDSIRGQNIVIDYGYTIM